MSLGGQDQPSAQVIVYGPDGRMYGNPEQAKAAGVENPTFQPPENVAPAAAASPYANGQFMPMPMAPEPSMMTGYGGPEGVMEPFTGAPAGGKGGAMQPRLTPLGSQPFSQPSRSFGGLNRFMPANSMSQYQTPMAMPMPQFGQGGVMDPTAMAQQAILARPMRPSFTGQPLLSREVPLGIQGNSGLAYPSMASTGLLNVPSYTSRYASGGGGSGGSDASQAPSSWSSMTPAEQAAYYAANPNMAAVTRAGQAAFGYTLPGLVQGLMVPGFVQDQGLIAMGVDPAAYQNAKESFRASEINAMNAGYPSTIDVDGFDVDGFDVGGFGAVGNYGNFSGNTGNYSGDVGGFGADAAAGANTSVGGYSGDVGGFGADAAAGASSSVGGSGSESGGGGKIVCTAMNQQYGFGSFRNAIWLKYAENNLTKAHEAGYHAIFLPLVDFAFKQGDGKLNMLTRKFLENCARHRSLDLRAEMRGTKRDTIGMIYRSVLEPLCYAVGKFKGY